MSTSWGFTLGYNGNTFDPDEEWQMFLAIVAGICHDPDRIATEARRLGAPEQCVRGCCTLDEMVEAYRHPESRILYIDGKDRSIHQLMNGGYPLKLAVRRAFTRLVIEDAHRQGLEVNVYVG